MTEKFKLWELQHAINTAKKIIESGEELQPMFFGYNKDSFILVPGFFSNDTEKENFLSKLKLIFIVFNIDYYVQVCEAWVSMQENLDNFKKPSLDPKKKEALVASCVGYEEKKMVMYDILSSKNKRTISEKPTSESDNFIGTFSGLLPPKNVKIPQQLRDDVIEELKKAGIQIHKKTYSNETLN